MATETVIPVKLRTARVRHDCGQCGRVIEPGELYEVHALPPYRDPNFGAGWWVMATHVAAYPIRRGCDEAAAYRERAEREQVNG